MTETMNRGPIQEQVLNVTVHDAWGFSKEEEPVWDDNFTEGLVKGKPLVESTPPTVFEVELRGDRTQKRVSTNLQKVDKFSIVWKEELKLELTEFSRELRIMLCKENPKSTSARRSSSVIAACGIYVGDILQAVPIDKAFELFKPGEQETSLGGYIRVTLTLAPSNSAITTIEEHEAPPQEPIEVVDRAAEEQTAPEPSGNAGGRAMGLIRGLLFMAGVAVAVVFFKGRVQQKKD